MTKVLARDALSSAVVRVAAESRPRDMTSEIEASGASYAAVFEGDRWLGLVALREAATMGSERLFVDLLDQTHGFPHVSSETPLTEVRRVMDDADRHAAAVLDGERYVGVVTRPSIAEVLSRQRVEESEQRREIAEERARTLFESASDGILIVDREGTIESANYAAEKMFGYDRATIAHVPAIELIDHAFREPVENHARAVREKARSERLPSWWEPDWIEAAGRRADGSTFAAEMTLSPMPDEGFAVIVRDISRRKELERQLADAAVEERRLLAQDLHDSLSSQMTALGLYASNIRKRLSHSDLAETDPATVKMCDTLVSEMRNAHEVVRRFSHGLMPIEEGPGGLPDALERLADWLREADGMDIACLCDDGVHVDDLTVATNLYQIAQEASHNALRHGEARSIIIRLESLESGGRLSIEDNGKGIASDGSPSDGIGLRSMRHRAELIGGSLTIGARPEGGTRVCCRFPVSFVSRNSATKEPSCS